MLKKRDTRNTNRDDMHVDYVTGKRANFTRFYINIGSKSNLNPTKLIGLLLDTTNNRQLNIGKIDIMKGFSFFEVEQEYESIVLKSFNKNVRRDGTRLRVEISNERPAQSHPSRHAQFKTGRVKAKKSGANPYMDAHRRKVK
jgi:ATP-dependent RNA helicase DeaD